MNNRLIRGSVLIATLLWGASAMAHPPGDGCGRHVKDPEARIARLTSALDLYPDQVPQVEAIFAESRAQIQAIRETNTLAQRDLARVEMQAVHEETRQRLATVLTAEQLEKMDQMRQQHRGKRGHKQRKVGNLEAVQPIQPPETAD